MKLQEIIDLNNNLLERVIKVKQFSDLVEAFCSKPKSKKEVIDFSETIIVNHNKSRKEYLNIAVSLTNKPSFYNSSKLRYSFLYGDASIVKESQIVLDKDLLKLKCLIAEYIKEIHDKLIELNYPDISERIIALRRNIKKFNEVLYESNTLLTEEQIRDCRDFDEKGTYLTSSLDSLLEEFKKTSYGIDDGGIPNLVSDIQVKNIKTFVDYLTSFLTY